jgi:hypothetical protein
MQQWIYFGPYRDPHYRAFIPGMTVLPHPDNIVEYAGMGWPHLTAKPFEAVITRISGIGHTVLAFRERWHTQLSPAAVCSAFITRGVDISPEEMLAAIPRVFPEVWTRFEKITICPEPPSPPTPPAASASILPNQAPGSTRAKRSGKSSA